MGLDHHRKRWRNTACGTFPDGLSFRAATSCPEKKHKTRVSKHIYGRFANLESLKPHLRTTCLVHTEHQLKSLRQVAHSVHSSRKRELMADLEVLDEYPKPQPDDPESATNAEPAFQVPPQVLALMVSRDVTQPEVLRCTYAGRALSWGGQALRGKVEAQEAHRLSWPCERIAQFWSHSWHGSLWAKVLTLLLVQNGTAAVCCGTLACIVHGFLWRELAPDLRGADDPLITVFSMACGILVAALTLLLWSSGKTVFVDQLCIHQKDAQLKLEGVLSMGGFLKASESCLVCWDDSYSETWRFPAVWVLWRLVFTEGIAKGSSDKVVAFCAAQLHRESRQRNA